MPSAAPLQPLLELLHQMRRMIERLDDVAYSSPAPRSSSGVGGHVRHCLDHVSALIAGTRTGMCTYDRRERGTDIETCRRAAVRAITDLTETLVRLDPSLLDQAVCVETQIDAAGAMTVATSSIGREVAFVISHTIHHNAIVGQMLHARGYEVAPRFGLAPSTPSDEPQACAR